MILFYIVLTVLSVIPAWLQGCEVGIPVFPNIYKRTRDNDLSNGESSFQDEYIQEGWYSAYSDGKQYLIPDGKTVPPSTACGGYTPVFIATHPDVSTLDENPVKDSFCAKTSFDNCNNRGYTIQVRKCNGEIQYYLKTPSLWKNVAYCFDPPEDLNVPNDELSLPAAPANVSIGVVNIVPKLEYVNGSPSVKLLCQTSLVVGSTSNLIFHTLWYADNTEVYHFETNGSTYPLSETELKETGLGKNMSCSVQLAYTSPGRKTSAVSSNVYYSGIKVLDTHIRMEKETESVTIRLRRELPFGCRQNGQTDSTRCNISVQLSYVDYCSQKGNVVVRNSAEENSSGQQKCGVEFQGSTGEDDDESISNESTMTISTIDKTVSDPDSYTLQLKVQYQTDHDLWNDYSLEPILVTVNDALQYKFQMCAAHNDPHMQTFTGYPYEHQHVEDSILYRNVKYQTEVQIRTKSCNRNRAQCTCAVAIRAGGDVYLINYCSNHRKNWFNGMTSCKDNGIIGMKDNYKFYTPIGTTISIMVTKGYGLMNVHILMAPKDLNNADGLCGKPGSGSDIVDRNGSPTYDHRRYSNRNYHDTFSEAWKLKPTDKNYLDAQCYPDATPWAQGGSGSSLNLYCACEECVSTSCTESSQVHCSPSQYLDCPLKVASSKLECQRWKERCSVQENRKKRDTRGRHFTSITSKPHLHAINKREAQNYSESEAERLCEKNLLNHPAFSYVSSVTGGFNVTQAIANCAFDTCEGQTNEWIDGYMEAITDVVEINLEKDPDYEAAHKDTVAEFRQLSCPFNCSGNGYCTDKRKCSCIDGFGGTDCSIDLTAELVIYGIGGNGLCDVTTSECARFEIQTFDLKRGFTCKVKELEVLVSGKKIITSTETYTGEYISLFTAACSLQEATGESFELVATPVARKRRSTDSTGDDVLAYEYQVSISNDGTTFSKEISVIIYDPDCMEVVEQPDGNLSIHLLDGTCFINGSCSVTNETTHDMCCVLKDGFYLWSKDSPEDLCAPNDELCLPAAPVNVSIGIVKIVPKLEYVNGFPSVKLLCQTSSVVGCTSNLIFHTLWYADNTEVYHFETNGSTNPLSETELKKIGLGKNMSCSVQLAYASPGRKTSAVSSDVYYSGIKVLDTHIQMDKETESVTIRLRRELPFGCRQNGQTDSPRCSISVQMSYVDYCSQKGNVVVRNSGEEYSSGQQKCGVEFQGSRGEDDDESISNESTMTISTIDKTVSDPDSYTLQLKVQYQTDHDLWNDYSLEPILVTVNDSLQYKFKMCAAHNDPHMQTFTGYPYEHQHVEDSILYRNVKYQTEVQIRTKSCNRNRAQCTCAVAIRAGGDVYLINYCSNYRKNWFNGMTSCKDSGIIGMTDSYKFYTPIGTMISIMVSKRDGLMNVHILMAPKDLNNADGLCGKPGSGSDIVDRDGNPTYDHRRYSNRNYHKTFSEAWKLKPTEKNYLDAKCYPDATPWAQGGSGSSLNLYCACEECVSTRCTERSEAHCSPSQYLDCPLKVASSKRECQRWKERCSVQENRKKRDTRGRHFTSIKSKPHVHAINKREAQNYSESEAERLCEDNLLNHPAFTHVISVTKGFNVTQAIANCAFDTYEGQTNEWIDGYMEAVTDVVEMNLEKDPDYEAAYRDTVAEFRQLSCPFNCSGNGYCTEKRNCSCIAGFGGTDCSIDLTAELVIYGIDGNGLCDVTTSDCTRFEIQTFDVIQGFTCKVKELEVLVTGEKIITSTESYTGEYISLFTAVCSLPEARKRRSTDSTDNNEVLAYEYQVSISNDGNTFSEDISVVIYDPECMEVVEQPDGRLSVQLLDGTCFINGMCSVTNETTHDMCCVLSDGFYLWSKDCSDPENDAEGLPLYAIIVLATATPVILLAGAYVAFYIWKKMAVPARVVSPGPGNIKFPKRTLSRQSTADLNKISIVELH